MEAGYYLSEAFWTSQNFHQCAQKDVLKLSELADLDLPTSAVVFRSSGTSGVKKWIVHTRESLLASAEMVNQHLEVTSSDVFGLLLPLEHVGGFGVVARAYLSGAELVQNKGKWNPQEACEFLADHQVTVTSFVPTQVYDLVQSNLTAPKSLRAIVVGGGTLTQELGHKARELGWSVLASYGMTEAGSQIATSDLDLTQPFQNDSLRILSGWETSLDESGKLSIKGEALCKGILYQNEERFEYQEISEFYKTNDCVKIREGNLTFSGRVDRTIKVKGELVNLDEIQQGLNSSLKGEFAIKAQDHERAGKQLTIYTTCETSLKALRLPPFIDVEKVVVMERIPKTALGKIDFLALE